jgi:DNA-directed RNA polymerase subunit L
MELEVINHTKKQLLIKVKGENETLLNPIVQELLRLKDVDYATIETDHPNDSYRRLYVRLVAGSKQDPLILVKKALKQVKKVTAEFKKEFEKVMPAK